MLTCTSCGEESPDGFRYCGHCGAQLVDDRGPAGERRHLTVMFCDLVGSTELSEAVDPEIARDFVHRYQVQCGEIIERHGGYLARFIGDGLLAYFGYPRAHDDDGARAVRAGLEIVDAVGRLTPIASPGAPVPGARVGIDTGEVVVTEMAAGRHRQPMEVVGRAPNVAARLQSLAQAGWVVLTDSTARLVEGFAVLEPQGSWQLRGVAKPVDVFRALRPTRARARFDVAASRGLTPLAGRSDALRDLTGVWRRIVAGSGEVVLIVGDAGIGKTRLVHELVAREVSADAVVVHLSCLPDHQATPLHPVVRELVAAMGRRAENAVDALRAALEAAGIIDDDALPLFAELLGFEEPEVPAEQSPRRKLTRTLELLQRWLLGAARDHLLVIVVENLHWADPSTLELLTLFATSPAAPRVLALMTARSEFVAPWSDDANVHTISLQRLSADDVSAIVETLAGDTAIPPSVIDDIVERADGVPLFVEELTRAVVDGEPDKASDRVPATLHDSLLARLDRLGRGRDVIGVAAVIGREFGAQQVERVASLDTKALSGWLTMLEGAGIVRAAPELGEDRYRFKHALVRDAAYQSLLLSDRRRLHAAVADDVRVHEPQILDSEPEVVARHYREAGRFEEALRFWRRAARRAETRGSLAEAVDCMEAAVEDLGQLAPSSERDEHELRLLLRLGLLLYVRFGGGDERIGAIFERTGELVGTEPMLRMLVLGLAATHFHDSGHHERNVEVTRELINLAEATGDEFWKLTAYASAATPHLELGRVREAEQLLERALAHYRPEFHLALGVGYDPGTNSHTELAWVRWHRGQPDRAVRELEALSASLPNEISVYSRAHVAVVLAMMRVLRREPEAAGAQANAAASLAREHGLDHVACHAQWIVGWHATATGDPHRGVDVVAEALDRHRSLGVRSGRERGLTMLALACQAAGRAAEARAALHEGQELVTETGARREAPELWRIEAELSAAEGDHDRALHLAQHAVTLSRESESLGYELRALTTMAQLQPDDGAVRNALANVYGSFTDGHDTADLKAAALLLSQQANGWPGVAVDASGVPDERRA